MSVWACHLPLFLDLYIFQYSLALLMSAVCVLLSPPHKITTITGPSSATYILYLGPKSSLSSITPSPTDRHLPRLPNISLVSRTSNLATSTGFFRLMSHSL